MEQIKNVKVLTVSAMMLALATVLGFFKIPVTELIELRFGFLPIACSGMLFGPVVGGIVGALSDILGYFAKPTGPYFPGFTFSAMVSGAIYGFFLHGKVITLKRLIGTHLLKTFIISFVLNPLWLSVLYGKAFTLVTTARFVKSAVMFPIEIALLWFILKPAKQMSAGWLAAPLRKG